jgi:hypothetical protein
MANIIIDCPSCDSEIYVKDHVEEFDDFELAHLYDYVVKECKRRGFNFITIIDKEKK